MDKVQLSTLLDIDSDVLTGLVAGDSATVSYVTTSIEVNEDETISFDYDFGELWGKGNSFIIVTVGDDGPESSSYFQLADESLLSGNLRDGHIETFSIPSSKLVDLGVTTIRIALVGSGDAFAAQLYIDNLGVTPDPIQAV